MTTLLSGMAAKRQFSPLALSASPIARQLGSKSAAAFLLVGSILATVDYRFFGGTGALISFSIFELTTFMLCGLLLVGVLDQSRWARSIASTLISRAGWLLVFYWVLWVTFVAALLAADKYTMERCRDAWSSFAIVVVGMALVDSSTRRKEFFRAVTIGYLVALLIGASQLYLGGPYPTPLGVTAMEKLNFDAEFTSGEVAAGWFTHPIGHAIYLIPALGLALFLWPEIWGGRLGSKFARVCFFALLVVNLYGTYSKGVLVWVAVGLLVLLLRRLRPNLLASMSLLLLAGVWVGLIAAATASDAVPELATFSGRFVQWTLAVKVIAGDPLIWLLGGGAQAMVESSAAYSRFGYVYPNAHNGYLNLILMFGLPACLCFILFVAKAFRRLARRMRRQRPCGVDLWAFFVLYVMLGVMATEPFFEGGAFISILLLACVVAMRSVENHES